MTDGIDADDVIHIMCDECGEDTGYVTFPELEDMDSDWRLPTPCRMCDDFDCLEHNTREELGFDRKPERLPSYCDACHEAKHGYSPREEAYLMDQYDALVAESIRTPTQEPVSIDDAPEQGPLLPGERPLLCDCCGQRIGVQTGEGFDGILTLCGFCYECQENAEENGIFPRICLKKTKSAA